jgi:hypothetical protein
LSQNFTEYWEIPRNFKRRFHIESGPLPAEGNKKTWLPVDKKNMATSGFALPHKKCEEVGAHCPVTAVRAHFSGNYLGLQRFELFQKSALTSTCLEARRPGVCFTQGQMKVTIGIICCSFKVVRQSTTNKICQLRRKHGFHLERFAHIGFSNRRTTSKII